MPVIFDDTIVSAMDPQASADFISNPPGIPPAARPGHSTAVRITGEGAAQ